jgi:hypothetical protein
VAQVKAWKALEKSAAEMLGGVRVHRVSTPFLSESWFQSAPDVIVSGPFVLVIECKYRKRFAHHTLLEQAALKYCRDGQEPVLVTKEHGQRGAYATVRLEFLSELFKQSRGDL